MWQQMSNRFLGRLFSSMGYFFGFLFIVSYLFYVKGLNETVQEAIEESIQQADKVAYATAQEIRSVNALAEELLTMQLQMQSSREQQNHLRKALSSNDNINSLGIIYDQPSVERPDLYLSRNRPNRVLLAEDSSQWVEERLWYDAFKTAPKDWGDSAFSTEAMRGPKVQLGKMLGNEGALFLQLTTAKLEQIVNKAKLGNAGYAFIVSATGHFIYHPVDDWLYNKQTVFDTDYALNSDIFKGIEKARQGERDLIEFSNPINGLDTWYFFEPIEGTDWVLGVTFFKEEMVNNIYNRRQHQITLSILFVLAIGFALLGFNYLRSSNRRIYATVVMITLVFLAGIIFIITISFKYPILRPYDLERDDVKIAEIPVLEHYLDIQDSIYSKFDDKQPEYIKTGIYVEHAALREAHMVMVSGYVWQEYELGKHDHIRRGIVFPEADPHPEFMDIQEAFRETKDGKEVVGWFFRIGLRKKFNYEHFPFDWQNIRIKLQHPDFLDNVLCIPDLNAYPILNPSSLPGIKAKFEFPNWLVRQSFFSFKNGSFAADFGVRPVSSRTDIPELCFNIYIKRIFISPLVSNMFTIAIIIILLFVAQVIESNKSKNKERSGVLLGNLGLIELSAAFSFVLILAHTSLRDNLSVEELIYIDYYYFTTYFMILLTCINFIVINKKSQSEDEGSRKISRDWLKIHFWPILFGMFYLVTVLVFY